MHWEQAGQPGNAVKGHHRSSWKASEEKMEQLASAPPPDGSFGALLRAFRHRAYLSQEQLAARAELSERTVRNLEAGRVRSPRTDTVRLLADALALTEPERESWVAAAQGANGRQAQAGLPGAGGPAQPPRRVTVAVLTAGAQDASGPAITCLIGGAGQTVLVVHCAHRDVARYPLARLTLPAAQPARICPATPAARSR
jgi:transcriptional regulator with XRE-family HTH domain